MKIQLLTLSFCVLTLAQVDRNSDSEIGHNHYGRTRHRSEKDIELAADNIKLDISIPYEIESITAKSKRMGCLRCKRHFNHNSDRQETRGNHERHHDESSSQKNGLRNTHNREWHERHGIPMPQEGNDNGRVDGERCHHFTHNHEWHDIHGIPMPENSHHCTESTTTRPSFRLTTRPTIRPTTRSATRPTTRSATRPTTRSTSTELYNPRRRDDEYDEEGWFQTTIRPTTRTTARPTIRTSTRTTARPTESSREIYNTRRQNDEYDEAEWFRPTTTTTLRPTTRTTTRPSTRTTTWITARPTESSREIYDPSPRTDEYDVEWSRMP